MPQVTLQPVVFRSAVDHWFYLVLLGSGAIIFVSVLPLLHTGHPEQMLVALLATGLGLGLPLWLLLTTRYIVDGAVLEVRSGPCQWRIMRRQITSVRASRSTMAAPALSLNRLEIRYGNGQCLLVSPADREGFLRCLGFPNGRTDDEPP
ncbi:MAG: PH domain-containing protein [Gammaproteobacteria bacterium]|nr:PH domain-containing protein [Gammaproteobacteria bacterium]TVQ44335.1 MAG: hypothetical protein EA371_13875 [Gammaproteobacteria bacterium]